MRQALALLGKESGSAHYRVQMIAADGSGRVLLRLGHGEQSVIAIAPENRSPQALAEARSAWLIGRHLHDRGIPVPEPLAFDPASGLLLCEDLGEARLHDLIGDTPVARGDSRYQLYLHAVRALAGMQVVGAEGFDSSWCWDTPRYDRALMLERESGYFLRALCRDLLELPVDTACLEEEFEAIAGEAAAIPSGYFLHRDFQCRNLMVRDGLVRVIDFQGGRLGPLAYDLASLLRDPYADLQPEVQDALLEEYLHALKALIPYPAERFRHEYCTLALQRNLQILGAFAFLWQRRSKPFFRQFLRPALLSLQGLLSEPGGEAYPCLVQTVAAAQEKLAARQNLR